MNKRLFLEKNKLLFYLVYFLLLVPPFISIAEHFIGGIGWIKEAICICICLISLGSAKLTNYTVPALCYVILVLIGIIIGQNYSFIAVFDSIRYRSMYIITFILLFSCVNKRTVRIEKYADTVFHIMFIIGMIVALIAIVEIIDPLRVYSIYGNNLTLHRYIIINGKKYVRLISTLSNPINLGLQMVISMSSAIYLIFDKKYIYKKVWHRLIYLSGAMLFIFIIILTYSRTAYIALMGTVFSFFVIRIFYKNSRKRKKFLQIIGMLLAALMLTFIIGTNENLSTRISHMSIGDFKESIRYREVLETFQKSNGNIINYFLGFGIGVHIGDGGQHIFELGYASLLFESGAIGLGIFVWYIITAFRICKKVISSSAVNYRLELLANTFFSIIGGFICSMISEDTYMQLPYCLYFWLSIFMLNSLKYRITYNTCDDIDDLL